LLPVARDGAVHDTSVQGPDRGLSQSESVHYPGAEAFDDDIGLSRQFQGPPSPRPIRFLEVEHDAALASIDRLEELGIVPHGIAARRFDLHHVGAQTNQERSGVGTGPPDAQIQHRHLGEQQGG